MADRAVLRIVCGDVIGVCDTVIVFLMAGPTIRRSPGVNTTDVTIETVRFDVRAGQRESGQVVIEGCFGPVLGAVTNGTVLREA